MKLRFRYMDDSGKTVQTGTASVQDTDFAVYSVRTLVFPFRPEIHSVEIRNMPGEAIWFRRVRRPEGE
jgi:hypothetical protein